MGHVLKCCKTSLCYIIQNCSTQNPAEEIDTRVRKHREKFRRNYVELTGKNQEPEAEQRFTLAQRLYYRVMDAMLQIVSVRVPRGGRSKRNLYNVMIRRICCTFKPVFKSYCHIFSSPV